MPPATPILRHIHHSLNGTPAALRAMVGRLPADSAFWDCRPDPARFTAREVMAHLADWNGIFESRIDLTLAENRPILPILDEVRLPIEHDYSHQDPQASLEAFCATRAAFVERVRAFSDAEWARAAHREDLGDLTIGDQVVLITIHDGYHLRQIAEYLEFIRPA
jgi:hypothetical protein